MQTLKVIHSLQADTAPSWVARLPLKRKLTVLLVKPYQPINTPSHAPPLGLLYLASNLQQLLKENVDIHVIDMKLERLPDNVLDERINAIKPDVIGFSALNYEAVVTHALAERIKKLSPNTITVVGGPYALKNASSILADNNIDWVFEGPADRTFAEALYALASEQPIENYRILGMSFRTSQNEIILADKQDFIDQLDELPHPNWDLVDLDKYAKKTNMAVNMRGKRYALLFTSRGCPYLCNYCHDIFTKKYVYHSVDYVINEIDRLHSQYGVDEFHIVDDIFNLHKPRLKAIMAEVKRRWPGKLKFTFPNGVRADILDRDVIDALVDAGTYLVCIAVETVTPRLQKLVEKNLNIEKTKDAIDYLNARGVQVTGFFMLGFPTETLEEIQATIDFACDSDLTLAFFFTVVPQYGTPIYDLAYKENATATENINNVKKLTYRDGKPWYEQAYGHPIRKYVNRANLRFFLTPKRIVKIYRHFSHKWLFKNLINYIELIKS